MSPLTRDEILRQLRSIIGEPIHCTLVRSPYITRRFQFSSATTSAKKQTGGSRSSAFMGRRSDSSACRTCIAGSAPLCLPSRSSNPAHLAGIVASSLQRWPLATVPPGAPRHPGLGRVGAMLPGSAARSSAEACCWRACCAPFGWSAGAVPLEGAGVGCRPDLRWAYSPFGARSCAIWQRLQAPGPRLRVKPWVRGALSRCICASDGRDSGHLLDGE
jgi:hypothetical protein